MGGWARPGYDAVECNALFRLGLYAERCTPAGPSFAMTVVFRRVTGPGGCMRS